MLTDTKRGHRELYVKTGQGFLLVFSITSLSSLYELSRIREQIVNIKDDDSVPIVIVGNKSDLEDERTVTRSEAFSVSQNWGNAPYYETSARRRGKFPFTDTQAGVTKSSEANVEEVFIDLCRQIIRKDNAGALSIEEEIVYGYEDPGEVQGHVRRDGGQHSHGRRRKKKPTCTIL